VKNRVKIDLHLVKHQNVFGVIEGIVRDRLKTSCVVEVVTGRSKKMQDEAKSAFLQMGFDESDIRVYTGYLIIEW
jgi:hypothetical protein